MRLWSGILGVCLLLGWAPPASAVAPIFTETSLRGTRAAAEALKRLARKPAGVDKAERLRTTTARHYKAVVILLEFPPDPNIPGDPGHLGDHVVHPAAAYDSLLFSLGTQPPRGSLRDYYREVSRGLFDIDGVTVGWYEAPHPYSYYTAGLSGFGDPPNNAQQMAHDAVVLADADIDFRQFDNDGPDQIPNSGDDDGFVDALFVVHAGAASEETASTDDIHSHKWTLETPYSTGDIGFGGAIRVNAYTSEAELWAGLAPHTAANQIMSVGTFCHEFGHVLGLPDMYDTRDDPEANEGMGEWDLMGSGNFCHAPGESLGTAPSHFSAWSKIQLGWVAPNAPLTDQIGASIPPVESGGPIYRLWTNGDIGTEYFLAENRQPVGFDVGLTRNSTEQSGLIAHGLVIYHVDESAPDNNVYAHKKLDVVEAGGASGVGVQNLDVHRGDVRTRDVCGSAASVTGNRGDRYDPWPGPLLATQFNSGSCPSSRSYCGSFSQVAVLNIDETGGTITADLHVRAASVLRLQPNVDDTPRMGTLNDGDGRAEPGESVRLLFPLLNFDGAPSPALYAKVTALDAFTTVTAGDSIDYGVIGGAQPDSGTAVDVTVNLGPDPIGAGYRYAVYSACGLVMEDTVQVLVGTKTGICDDFEGTAQRWYGATEGCTTVNEWHRESGIANHTPSGAWSWRLGKPGVIDHYAGNQDARLISQPIRLTGSGDTLVFWQRYSTQLGTDGVSVEISQDAGQTWTLIHPVPDYNFIDRWTGTQSSFVQARVPLTGYAGVVQVGFRFRSSFFPSGLGWWIDDVVVTGNASCGTTATEVIPMDAQYDAARSRVRLSWDLGGAGIPSVGIDREVQGEPRSRVANPSGYFGQGTWEDLDPRPGRVQSYWVLVNREGGAVSEYGPVQVSIPTAAPRPFALGPVRPNPFNPEATLPVSLDRDGAFTLRVFRVDGVLVRTLYDGPGTAGAYPFRWDGRDDRGRSVPGGVYLIELKSANRARVEKAILLR